MAGYCIQLFDLTRGLECCITIDSECIAVLNQDVCHRGIRGIDNAVCYNPYILLFERQASRTPVGRCCPEMVAIARILHITTIVEGYGAVAYISGIGF